VGRSTVGPAGCLPPAQREQAAGPSAANTVLVVVASVAPLQAGHMGWPSVAWRAWGCWDHWPGHGHCQLVSGKGCGACRRSSLWQPVQWLVLFAC
jgi:hypothetical protein